MKNNNTILGIILAIASVFFFSTYAIFGKILLKNLTPETFIAFSQTISLLLILLVYGFLPEVKKILSLPKKKIFLLILMSLLSAVVAPLLFLKGLEITLATNAMIIGKIEPIFVAIISLFWIHEKMNFYQILGSILMFTGVIFVSTKGFSEGLVFNSGDILIIAGAFAGSISTSIYKKYVQGVSPEIVVIMRNGIGAIVLLGIVPFLFQFSHSTQNILSQEVIIPLILFALFTVIAAQILWYKSLSMISACTLSSLSMLGPLFGILMATTILHEEIYIFHVAGFILVLIGLAITLHHEQQEENYEKQIKIKNLLH